MSVDQKNSISSYASIAALKIYHGYFSDGVDTSIKLEPCEYSKRIINSQKIRFKLSYSRLDIRTLNQNLVPKSWSYLNIYLCTANGLFKSYSDIPEFPSDISPFSSEIPLITLNTNTTKVNCHFEPQVIRVEGAIAPKNAFALLRIKYRQATLCNTISDIRPKALDIQAKKYNWQLCFVHQRLEKSASQLLVKNSDDNDCYFEDLNSNEEISGCPVTTFQSNKPIFAQEHALKGLSLQNGNKTIIKSIKNPSVSSIIKHDKPDLIQSIVYI